MRGRGVGDDLRVHPGTAGRWRELQGVSRLRDGPWLQVEAGSRAELVGAIQSSLNQPKSEAPHGALEYRREVRQVLDPMFLAGNLQYRPELPRSLERRADRRDLVAQAAHLAPRPLGRPQLANLDTGSRCSSGEDLGRSDENRHGRLIQEGLRDQLVPVDVHDAFVAVESPCGERDAVAKLVDGEASESLLAERKPVMAGRTPPALPLPVPVIVPRNQPHRTEHVQGHAVAIVGHGDRRRATVPEIHAHDDLVGVCVVCVLDQLEHGQPRAADQFIAEQL